MAQTLYEIDSKPLNYSAQCQGSYSSSDTDSQDQSRIPKYNSQILGTSTRSLIQQVLKFIFIRTVFLLRLVGERDFFDSLDRN